MEYARVLGYCAAKYLLEGGTNAVVTMVAGKFQPMRFDELIQPGGDIEMRPVSVDTEHYKIARRYMLRLRRDDFQNADLLARLSSTAKLSTDGFRQRFAYLVADEAPPIRFVP
jgi:6-phosphofructokinase 1